MLLKNIIENKEITLKSKVIQIIGLLNTTKKILTKKDISFLIEQEEAFLLKEFDIYFSAIPKYDNNNSSIMDNIISSDYFKDPNLFDQLILNHNLSGKKWRKYYSPLYLSIKKKSLKDFFKNIDIENSIPFNIFSKDISKEECIWIEENFSASKKHKYSTMPALPHARKAWLSAKMPITKNILLSFLDNINWSQQEACDIKENRSFNPNILIKKTTYSKKEYKTTLIHYLLEKNYGEDHPLLKVSLDKMKLKNFLLNSEHFKSLSEMSEKENYSFLAPIIKEKKFLNALG